MSPDFCLSHGCKYFSPIGMQYHSPAINVGSHFGTDPVLALESKSVPMPGLGNSHPQIDTIQMWDAQFQKRTHSSGTEIFCLILNLSAT